MRNPRILTWSSTRPRKSSAPSLVASAPRPRSGTSAPRGRPNGSATNRSAVKPGPSQVAAGEAGPGQVQLARPPDRDRAQGSSSTWAVASGRRSPIGTRGPRIRCGCASPSVALTVASVGPVRVEHPAAAAVPGHERGRHPLGAGEQRGRGRQLAPSGIASSSAGGRIMKVTPLRQAYSPSSRHGSRSSAGTTTRRPASSSPEDRGRRTRRRSSARRTRAPTSDGPRPTVRPPWQGVSPPRVGEDDSLRPPRGIRRVDRRSRRCPPGSARRGRRPWGHGRSRRERGGGGGLVEHDDRHVRPRPDPPERGRRDEADGCGVRERPRQPIGRVVRVERQIGGTGLQHRHLGDDHLRRPGHARATMRSGPAPRAISTWASRFAAASSSAAVRERSSKTSATASGAAAARASKSAGQVRRS